MTQARREPLKVIHCGTGIAGSLGLKALIENPAFNLRGLLVHSADKAGQDAGVLAGLDAIGVVATQDVNALAALDADVVCYMMLTPDVEHITAFLERGKSVVTTAGLMHPRLISEELAERLEHACRKGQSSLFTTGINPGWVDEVLPLTMTMLSRKVDRVLVREYADCGKYPAPHIISIMGFGKTPEQIENEGADNLEVMRSFFRQSVAALGHGLGIALDEVRETREFVLAKSHYRIIAGEIPAGTVAGQRWRWTGIANGRERVVQETYWFTAFDLGEGYPKAGDLNDDTLWEVIIEGEPSMRCTFEPRQSFDGTPVSTDYNPSGLATAMAAVNALRLVAEARPGILNAADLPGIPCYREAH